MTILAYVVDKRFEILAMAGGTCCSQFSKCSLLHSLCAVRQKHVSVVVDKEWMIWFSLRNLVGGALTFHDAFPGSVPTPFAYLFELPEQLMVHSANANQNEAESLWKIVKTLHEIHEKSCKRQLTRRSTARRRHNHK
jgi:hypothetical protein